MARDNPTVKYPMTVDELNEALQDPTQSTLTTSILWLAQKLESLDKHKLSPHDWINLSSWPPDEKEEYLRFIERYNG